MGAMPKPPELPRPRQTQDEADVLIQEMARRQTDRRIRASQGRGRAFSGPTTLGGGEPYRAPGSRPVVGV